MKELLVLYSTNTWLAYMIGKTYYQDEHYVWCTPYFDPSRMNSQDVAVPPTSSPLEIYNALFEEVSRGDRHSQRIKENRVGLLKGASKKREADIISKNQLKDIVSIIKVAPLTDFRPLMYIIPFFTIEDRLREPPPEDKAHPLSAEYIIDKLQRRLFDIIEFRKL